MPAVIPLAIAGVTAASSMIQQNSANANNKSQQQQAEQNAQSNWAQAQASNNAYEKANQPKFTNKGMTAPGTSLSSPNVTPAPVPIDSQKLMTGNLASSMPMTGAAPTGAATQIPANVQQQMFKLLNIPNAAPVTRPMNTGLVQPTAY